MSATIERAWESFRDEVLASNGEGSVAHLAFYAGAMALMDMQLKLADSGVTQNEAVVHMSDWADELKAFKNYVSIRAKEEFHASQTTQ